GWGEVERNDATVFNFPEGDTVVVNIPEQSYYQLKRQLGRENLLKERFILPDGRIANTGGITVRPIDKKENYIKRTICLPGETVEVIDRQVSINATPIENPKGIQFTYNVYTKSAFSSAVLHQKYGILLTGNQQDYYRYQGFYA